MFELLNHGVATSHCGAMDSCGEIQEGTSAVGLDTVARRDLMAFPDALQQQLLDICEVAETKGIWPLTGSVLILTKVTNAEAVGQYSPITVMPFYMLCLYLNAKQGNIGPLVTDCNTRTAWQCQRQHAIFNVVVDAAAAHQPGVDFPSVIGCNYV